MCQRHRLTCAKERQNETCTAAAFGAGPYVATGAFATRLAEPGNSATRRAGCRGFRSSTLASSLARARDEPPWLGFAIASQLRSSAAPKKETSA